MSTNTIVRLEQRVSKLSDEITALQQELRIARTDAKRQRILDLIDTRKDKLARINAEIVRSGLDAFWQAVTR